jgi:PPK2 family polyphosphate:nucleotide phosphotransferase
LRRPAVRIAEGDPMKTDFTKELIAKRGKSHISLSQRDPGDTLGWEKDHKTKDILHKTLKRLDKLQYLMYAEQKWALLIVLQGLDASGKDGTIRSVMSGVNPQGCRVTSFKTPSADEASHDFLWRVHKAVPPRGDIGIFNRSQYEDVLIVRVHKLLPKSEWSRRYDEINDFEKMLAQNGVKILKFFLHISKDEQRKRFQARIDDPDKRWKISPDDFKERKYWDDYMVAYEDVLKRCSTPVAPWFVIPANKKWFRNLAVARIIVETLEGMHMKFPPPKIDVKKLKWK